jgi:hypothetical protein
MVNLIMFNHVAILCLGSGSKKKNQEKKHLLSKRMLCLMLRAPSSTTFASSTSSPQALQALCGFEALVMEGPTNGWWGR